MVVCWARCVLQAKVVLIPAQIAVSTAKVEDGGLLSTLCATGQGGTDTSANSSVHRKGGRWWSVDKVVGDASGHQIGDYICIRLD